MKEIEKLDAFSDIETMLENEYTLTEAIDRIAKGYSINSFQLGIWYADYKKGI
ncbi:hypothetical protein LCGC14_1519880 [marine sediment metagenome]|uniref:Uncharacterized protein n=1 Tax=marine sediment metagenome TaxID=412755 RepID=A0A0F9IZ01_9ZZZZ